jgi:hypothetical protein
MRIGTRNPMSEAKLSKTKISIRRLIVLFLLVNGAIAAVAVVCIVGLAMMPRIQAFTWHLRNGDHVTLGGHRFAVPATYGVEVSESELHIEIMQTPGMIKSGLGGVTIESKGKVLDEIAAAAWQTKLIDAINHAPHHTGQSSAVTMDAKRLRFVCVNLDTGQFVGTLLCHAVGTNLSASVITFPGDHGVSKSILLNSD